MSPSNINNIFRQRVHEFMPDAILEPTQDYNGETEFKVIFPTNKWELLKKTEGIVLDIEDEFGVTIHIHPVWNGGKEEVRWTSGTS